MYKIWTNTWDNLSSILIRTSHIVKWISNTSPKWFYNFALLAVEIFPTRIYWVRDGTVVQTYGEHDSSLWKDNPLNSMFVNFRKNPHLNRIIFHLSIFHRVSYIIWCEGPSKCNSIYYVLLYCRNMTTETDRPATESYRFRRFNLEVSFCNVLDTNYPELLLHAFPSLLHVAEK